MTLVHFICHQLSSFINIHAEDIINYYLKSRVSKIQSLAFCQNRQQELIVFNSTQQSEADREHKLIYCFVSGVSHR